MERVMPKHGPFFYFRPSIEMGSGIFGQGEFFYSFSGSLGLLLSYLYDPEHL
jgi:hypothetical protein